MDEARRWSMPSDLRLYIGGGRRLSSAPLAAATRRPRIVRDIGVWAREHKRALEHL